MRFTYFFIFFILTFFACQNDSIPERVTFQSTPLDSVYQDLRPGIQEFSISNNQPNKIKATKGTEIFVPENSFVDANGNSIKGKVEVKLIEAFSIEDFITSGLATQSNGQFLISNGMLNIDATADGETIGLAEGKELTVSMPTMGDNMEGFQMFTGDGQNWEVDSSMTDDYLIPIPLELLYPEEVYTLKGDGGFPYFYTNENETLFNDSIYENTLIATEAFESRLIMLWYMTNNASLLEGRDFYFGKVKWKERKYNSSFWKTYLENLDKPIEELDILVKQKYAQYYDDNENELVQFVKDYKKQFGNDPIYFLHWFYGRNGNNDFTKENYLNILKYFSFNEKGKVKIINDHGVDLDSKDASNLLKEKGLSSNEINEILSYNFKRNAILNKLKRQKESRDSHQTISEFYETTSFSVKKLGWINCDRFYDLPGAKEAKILATNSSIHDLNFIDFSLVFPNMNARLSASINKDGNYAFTQNGIYSKLPIGEKAIVTAISFQNDSIYFAAQPIVIEENMQVDLELKLTSKEGLRDSLSVLF